MFSNTCFASQFFEPLLSLNCSFFKPHVIVDKKKKLLCWFLNKSSDFHEGLFEFRPTNFDWHVVYYLDL